MRFIELIDETGDPMIIKISSIVQVRCHSTTKKALIDCIEGTDVIRLFCQNSYTEVSNILMNRAIASAEPIGTNFIDNPDSDDDLF